MDEKIETLRFDKEPIEYSKKIGYTSLFPLIKDSQKIVNKLNSDLMDAVRYNNISLKVEEVPLTKWKSFTGKISDFKYWITGLRITHKDNISDCGWD